MKKEYLPFLVGAFLLLTAHIAFADVSISEIMYDPDGSDTNREWVEIHNDGDTSVDLTGWKFVEADTNHGLTSYAGGTSLAADEYGIIALDAGTFSGEYSVSGPIFDASFSLINSGGETLSLKDAGGNIVYTVSYDPTLGGNDDGNSLQKYNGAWVGADPTPGNANSDADTDGSTEDTGGGDGGDDSGDDNNDNTGDDNSDSSSSSSSSNVEQKNVEVNDEWQLTIFSDSYGVVGSPSIFTTEVENLYGNRVRPGRYVWNMGDGTLYDGKEYEQVTHTYAYPGDYVITLDYWRTGAFEKEMSVRHTFSVKATAMSIKGITKPDGTLDVELKNTSSSEVDLTGWTIVSSMRTYVMVPGTIILGNKTLTIPARSTWFTGGELQTLKLLAPDGTTIAASMPVATVITTSSRSYNGNSSSSSSRQSSASSAEIAYADDGANALAAQASKAKVDLGNNMWWMLTAGLIILGVGSTVYMRKGKEEADDEVFDVKVIGE